MKTKAKIKFCRFENALAMQVLYMDERFRGDNTYICKDRDMRIESAYFPYMGPVAIQLYGTNPSLDCVIVSFGCNVNVSLPTYITRAVGSLKDWAQNWEGWKDEPAIEPKIMDDFGNEIDLETYTGSVVVVEV